MEQSILPHDDFESDVHHKQPETKSFVCQGCFYCFPNLTEYQVHQNECSHVSVNQKIFKRSKPGNGFEHKPALPRTTATKLRTYSRDHSCVPMPKRQTYVPLPNGQTYKEYKKDFVNKGLLFLGAQLRYNARIGRPKKYANAEERKQVRIQQQRERRAIEKLNTVSKKEKLRVGRPRKYATEEERKRARALAARDRRASEKDNTKSNKRYKNVEESSLSHEDFESDSDGTSDVCHEQRETKPIVCQGCLCCFPNFTDYQVHQNECSPVSVEHEKTYLYPCSVCSAQFKDKYKLANHIFTQHSRQIDDDSGSATSFSRIESFDEDRVQVTLRLSDEEYLLPNVPVEETEMNEEPVCGIKVKEEPVSGIEVKEELVSGIEVNNNERLSDIEVNNNERVSDTEVNTESVSLNAVKETLSAIEINAEPMFGIEISNEKRLSLTDVKEEPFSLKSSKDQRITGD